MGDLHRRGVARAQTWWTSTPEQTPRPGQSSVRSGEAALIKRILADLTAFSFLIVDAIPLTLIVLMRRLAQKNFESECVPDTEPIFAERRDRR